MFDPAGPKVNCELRKYKLNEDEIITVVSQFLNCLKAFAKLARKKDLGASTGFEPVASALGKS